VPKVNLSIARLRRANSLHSWLARRQAAESVRAAALLLIRASDQPEETSLQLDPSQRVRTVVEDDIVERKRQRALGPSLRFASWWRNSGSTSSAIGRNSVGVWSSATAGVIVHDRHGHRTRLKAC